MEKQIIDDYLASAVQTHSGYLVTKHTDSIHLQL